MQRLHSIFATTILLALFVPACAAQQPTGVREYFGQFLDTLRGVFDPDAKPRPLFILGSDFRFVDPNGNQWKAPAGIRVDGASIPQAFWSVIGGPFEGAYLNASVIHDHYCRTKERTAHDTHRNFYYGMRATQVPDWKATAMYWAVSTFGPSWKLERRISLSQTCTEATPSGGSTCTTTPTVTVSVVEIPSVDLSDPEVLALAVSKTNAVARTLLTSNGKILDVSAVGRVSVTDQSIEKSAAEYRQLFTNKEFASKPERLGILSQQGSVGLGNIQPWANNRVPSLGEAIFLTPQTIPRIEKFAPFKLDHRGKDLIKGQFDIRSLETSQRLENRRQ
jgi:Protein of unknown function (DUF1353)